MREEWQENELRNAMGKVSRGNRVTLSRYIKLKRANGLTVGTLVNYVYWLRKLEEHVEGKTFEDLTPDDVTAFFFVGCLRTVPAFEARFFVSLPTFWATIDPHF